MQTSDLVNYTGRLLEVSRFRDYCPNGLQVEGRAETRKLATAVTASLAVVQRAVAARADTLLVHHGYFWKNEPAVVTGPRKARLALLLGHELNLVAYHLPLDAHPELGNNAALARRLDLRIDGWFGDQAIAAWGAPAQSFTLGTFAAMIEQRLARPPLAIGSAGRPLRRVAWCTGAAQDLLADAVELGVDAFLTGVKRPSERFTCPARPGSPSSRPATMRRNATGCRRWVPISRIASGSSTSFWTTKTRSEGHRWVRSLRQVGFAAPQY